MMMHMWQLPLLSNALYIKTHPSTTAIAQKIPELNYSFCCFWMDCLWKLVFNRFGRASHAGQQITGLKYPLNTIKGQPQDNFTHLFHIYVYIFTSNFNSQLNCLGGARRKQQFLLSPYALETLSIFNTPCSRTPKVCWFWEAFRK